MKIDCNMPAPEAKAKELHDNLVHAGQALSSLELTTFMLSMLDDEGKMTAGCKGEIAFKSAHVSELWVAETHRGQGVGRKLLAKAEQLAVGRGCVRLHLETRNEAARSLYEHLGYRIFGTLPDYDGDIPFHYLEKQLG